MKNVDFFEIEARLLGGELTKMERYKGKTILVVNTASQCGLTPQYEGLQNLYQTLGEKGLVVLGFPCNQFGSQEPGNSEEIRDFCSKNYGVSFHMFEKIEVNGKNTHPIFKYLKSKLPGSFFIKTIKWNFTKFVVDKNGKAIKRFSPTTGTDEIKEYLQKIL